MSSVPIPSTTLSPGVDLSVSAVGATSVIALRGEADVSGLGVLGEALARITADGAGDVVVDLSQVEFIDTATVRAVLGARVLLAADGRQLTLRSPSRVAARLLGLFGLTHLVASPAMAG